MDDVSDTASDFSGVKAAPSLAHRWRNSCLCPDHAFPFQQRKPPFLPPSPLDYTLPWPLPPRAPVAATKRRSQCCHKIPTFDVLDLSLCPGFLCCFSLISWCLIPVIECFCMLVRPFSRIMPILSPTVVVNPSQAAPGCSPTSQGHSMFGFMPNSSWRCCIGLPFRSVVV